MAERAHLSIGEVLSLLQAEFPDVTISKIRFLESQGLLDPERTPSGYRKFYEVDIQRLRWILHQQKDNFLPLRVIKDRLEGLEQEVAAAVESGDVGADLADFEPVAVDAPPPPRTREPAPPRPKIFEQLQNDADASEAAAVAAAPKRVEPVVESPPPPPPPLSRAPRTRDAAPPPPPSPSPSPSPLDSGPSAVSLTTDELVAACGLPDKALVELERYGLIQGRPMGRDTVYDEDALVVARLAASFAQFGVEPRHLRMYKVAAEREAGFFEQVVLPLLKQRNPSARRQAMTNLNELTSLGESLRGAMLRAALRGYTG